jgi:hypothetical protein
MYEAKDSIAIRSSFPLDSLNIFVKNLLFPLLLVKNFVFACKKTGLRPVRHQKSIQCQAK